MQTRVEELQGAEETERRSKEKAVKAAAMEAAAEKRKATQARVERMKEWDDEEVRMLEKALEKFPQVCWSVVLLNTQHSVCRTPMKAGRVAYVQLVTHVACMDIDTVC